MLPHSPPLDPASWTVPELIGSLADLGDGFADADEGVWLYAQSMRVTMPVELEMLVGTTDMVLGMTPPTQTVDTPFFPVLSRLTLTVDVQRTQPDETNGWRTDE